MVTKRNQRILPVLPFLVRWQEARRGVTGETACLEMMLSFDQPSGVAPSCKETRSGD